MKMFRMSSVSILICVTALFLFACGSATPTPVPPTTAPTAVPPTVAPTQAPTTVPTPAPTTASSTTSNAVLDAFKRFARAENFRMKADVMSAPAFFQPPYQPGPDDDPNMVVIVKLDGESHAQDLHYTLGGFIGQFAGVLSGFDEKNPTLEMIKVGDKLYMRGILPGEKQAKWYLLPDDQAGSMSFKPQDIVETVAGADFSAAAFTKTESVKLDDQTCERYDGDRAAFDAVFPQLAQQAALNAEEIDVTKLDTTTFQVVVCPDGNAHHIIYDFSGPRKSKPSEKGRFTYDAQLSGFNDTITITAPASAVPMPASANPFPTSEPTTQATPTSAAGGAFTSLDGDWEGTSSSDSPIQFTVKGDKITYANLNYAINTGGCSASGSYGTAPEASAIQDNKFTAFMTNSDGVKFVFAGTFESNNKASGTLDIQGKTFCGDVNENFTWTANHISSPDAQPTAEATLEIPTAPATAPTSASTTGGAAVLQRAFDAFNAGDVDGAIAVFDDNVIYNIGTINGIGKENLKGYLQTAAFAGAKFAVSNVQDLDSVVTFSMTVSGPTAGTYSDSSVIIQDGKIMILTIK